MVARYFFELLILYLFLNIIHIEKIKLLKFYLPVRGLMRIAIKFSANKHLEEIINVRNNKKQV